MQKYIECSFLGTHKHKFIDNAKSEGHRIELYNIVLKYKEINSTNSLIVLKYIEIIPIYYSVFLGANSLGGGGVAILLHL